MTNSKLMYFVVKKMGDVLNVLILLWVCLCLWVWREEKVISPICVWCLFFFFTPHSFQQQTQSVSISFETHSKYSSNNFDFYWMKAIKWTHSNDHWFSHQNVTVEFPLMISINRLLKYAIKWFCSVMIERAERKNQKEAWVWAPIFSTRWCGYSITLCNYILSVFRLLLFCICCIKKK